MSKIDRFEVLFWTKMLALFVGIVLAVVYQFTGTGVLILIGLAFFACAFLLMTVTEVSNLVALHATVIEAENSEQIETKKRELYNKKLLAWCKMILSLGMGAFAIVIMFLF